jgi:hypothetical protein
MLIKFREARGLKLFSRGSLRVELWYFPPLFAIEPHTHPNESIEVLYLGPAKVKFYRKKSAMHPVDKFYAKFPWHFAKKLSVPIGVTHWFYVVSSFFPLFAINISQFKKGMKPVSAAEDFQLTDKESII